MPEIRAKAVCVFRRGGKILLLLGHDPAKNERFLIPVGGGVEFGEASAAAVRREVLEEIAATIANLRLLGVQENLFEYDGAAGHEIVFVYEGDFTDADFYTKTTIQGTESGGQPLIAQWFDERELRAGSMPVYPQGLLDLLV